MTRMEYRGGDFSGSVHLYGAVLLAAGLAGIEEKLTIPPNAGGVNVEKLSDEERNKRGIHATPGSFHDTAKILKESKFLKETLGESM